MLIGKERDMEIFNYVNQHPGSKMAGILVSFKGKVSRKGFQESIERLKDVRAIRLEERKDYNINHNGVAQHYHFNVYFPSDGVSKKYLKARL